MLALPTIGLEQVLHTDRWALAALPLYHALHWLSDGLLALPLAAVAVWGGQRLAGRLGLGSSTVSDIIGQACLIVLFFALLLVPGAALHDVADRLTHVHAGLPTHSHVALSTQSAGGPTTLVRFVRHALIDGVMGQAVGLPLMILALVWGGRKQRPRDAVTLKRKEA